MRFLDTNVLVYCFDAGAPEKQRRALGIVQHALDTRQAIVSFQVVQEFLNVALRKFKVPLVPADCRAFLDAVLCPLCGVSPGVDLYRLALQIHADTSYSFYDALILAAAIEGGCDEVYSEDLQHGQTVRGLRIVNPFKAAAPGTVP